MTRKEKLIELAERCEDGKIEMESQLFKNAIVQLTNEVKEDIWWEHYRNRACLDAVAALEIGLLPDGFQQRICKEHRSYNNGLWWTVRNMNEDGSNPVYAGASTEPLARLSVLCFVIAEMD